MALRVGIDLVRTATVRAALDEHGDHYLARVFTPAEQAHCGADALKLAARFAAKEATMKVLQPGPDDPLPFTSIEVVRDGAAPVLHLHGPAAALAARAGIAELALSFTHEDDYAAAVVVGT